MEDPTPKRYQVMGMPAGEEDMVEYQVQCLGLPGVGTPRRGNCLRKLGMRSVLV